MNSEYRERGERTPRAVMIASALWISFAGCYGPNREPGDDPNRSDESPSEGRPKTDPREEVEPRDASGGSAKAPEESGSTQAQDQDRTLDGTSDEVLTPQR